MVLWVDCEAVRGTGRYTRMGTRCATRDDLLRSGNIECAMWFLRGKVRSIQW